MKKNLLNIAAVAFIASALVFTGCKKDEDTTAPVVTLNGASSQTISLQGTYTEQNATASDDQDGTLTPTASGTVNTNQTGTYTITYTASDAAGNVGTATRTVIVKNDASELAATYTVVDICGSQTFNYTQMVEASETVNNRITFNKFADYANNTSIYAMVTGSTITLPSQVAPGIGSGTGTCDVADHTFSSTSGTTNTSGFVITYTDQITSPNPCVGSASCTATFTRQ